MEYNHREIFYTQAVSSLSCVHVESLQTWSVLSVTVEVTVQRNASKMIGTDTLLPAKSSRKRSVKRARRRGKRRGKRGRT